MGALAASPHRGPDATGRLPAAEAPAGRRGLRKPPEQVNWVIIQVFNHQGNEPREGIFFNLQVIQKRTADAHFFQGHVRVAAVQKALDLRADVQGQSLSPLDLLWIQRCPGAIELLQSVLNTIQTSRKSLFRRSVLTNCCGAVIFGLSKNYLGFEMSLKCTGSGCKKTFNVFGQKPQQTVT